jgi:peroxiredoxin Q/BCP
MSAPPAVGSAAPHFDLPAAGGGEVVLESYRGRRNVVILFYPGAFTPVCTKEMCEFRDGFRELAALDAEVLGVSTDDLEKLERFQKTHHLPMRLLSDYSKAVCRRYGALSFLGHAKRATFVIDKAGVVRYARVQLPIFRPMPSDVAKVLLGLRKEGEGAGAS